MTDTLNTLIAEAREWVQEENWESDYEQDGFNRPGTDLIARLADALEALRSPTPTEPVHAAPKPPSWSSDTSTDAFLARARELAQRDHDALRAVGTPTETDAADVWDAAIEAVGDNWVSGDGSPIRNPYRGGTT